MILSRALSIVPLAFACTACGFMLLGSFDSCCAEAAKKTRQVQFPKQSLGRLYELKPGIDWIRVKSAYGQFFGTAANLVTVPQSARLLLELDANIGEQPRILESLDANALFSLRLRNLEPDAYLVPAISRLTGLHRLDVIDCTVTDKTVATLAHLNQLERLSLSSCGLNGDCMRDLVRLNKLKYLNISSNMLNSKSTSYISKIPTLVCLDVARTRLTDDALLSLSKLTNLTFLNINSNPALTSKGFLALRSLKKLDSLYAQNTSIKASDIVALKGLPLKMMFLPKMQIRKAEMIELHRIFPDCQIIMQSSDAGPDYDVIFAPVSR